MDNKIDRSIVLVIVDGFGINEDKKYNGIKLANTPIWDDLQKKYPVARLKASGNAVGLPEGVMGNSEVGHFTIGTGRVIYQSLEKINRSIVNETLSDNLILNGLIDRSKSKNNRIHLLGLLSDGGVHSHIDHLFYLIKYINSKINSPIYIHVITDGRDTPIDSGVNYVCKLMEFIKDKPNVKIATIIGRYYTMDRDNKWDRIEVGYQLMINGKGHKVHDPIQSILDRYNGNETDEFLKPMLINSDGLIEENDTLLFFNFRPDRARQITMALNQMKEFTNSKTLNLDFVSMTKYGENWSFPVLFENAIATNSLAEIISLNNFKQVHIAETEKYAHLTYFLNGGIETPFKNEERILIPSLKVSTYDLAPEMSTREIVSETINAISKDLYTLIIINIASPDMVGHTGIVEATIKALEIFDEELGRLYLSCIENKYTLILTSDHGNCELMTVNSKPHTAHTTNDVPFMITTDVEMSKTGGLSDVAPTILKILGVKVPKDMSGHSLIL